MLNTAAPRAPLGSQILVFRGRHRGKGRPFHAFQAHFGPDTARRAACDRIVSSNGRPNHINITISIFIELFVSVYSTRSFFRLSFAHKHRYPIKV